MSSINEETHVFIVRLWREPREIERATPQLRGTVAHVLSGEQSSVRSLDGVCDFMRRYLSQLGVDLDTSNIQVD